MLSAKVNNPVSMSKAVHDLSSTKDHKRYNALVLIRKKFLKEKGGYARLLQRKGISPLVAMVIKENDRHLNIVLSILGNCCTVEECREQVVHYGLLENLNELLARDNLSNSMKNRACRIIGNLTLMPEGNNTIYRQEDLVPKIVNILQNFTSDAEEFELKQTYCRTIRMLGDTVSHIDVLIEGQAVKYVATCLQCTHEATLTIAFKALAVLTKSLTPEVVRQLLVGKTNASILQFLGFIQNEDEGNEIDGDYSPVKLKPPPISKQLQISAQRVYQYLLKDSEMRAGFGSVGLLIYLTNHIRGILNPEEIVEKVGYKYAEMRCEEQGESFHLLTHNVNALALCCQDVVNRTRMRNHKSLPLLLLALKDDSFAKLHNRIISALVCFLYDDIGLITLVNNGLSSILLHHLRRVVPCLAQAEESMQSKACLVSTECCRKQSIQLQTEQSEDVNEPSDHGGQSDDIEEEKKEIGDEQQSSASTSGTKDVTGSLEQSSLFSKQRWSPELFDSSKSSSSDSSDSEEMPETREQLFSMCKSLMMDESDVLSAMSEEEEAGSPGDIDGRGKPKSKLTSSAGKKSERKIVKPSPLTFSSDKSGTVGSEETMDSLKCEETMTDVQPFTSSEYKVPKEKGFTTASIEKPDNELQSSSQSYSIYSPTFLAVQSDSDSKQEDYFFGPKNLRDSNLMFASPSSQSFSSPASQTFSSPRSVRCGSPYSQPFNSPENSRASYSPISLTSYFSPNSSPVYQFSPPASPSTDHSQSSSCVSHLISQNSVGSVASASSMAVPTGPASFNHLHLLSGDFDQGFHSDDDLNFGGSPASAVSEAFTNASSNETLPPVLGSIIDPLGLEMMETPLSGSQFSNPSSTKSSPMSKVHPRSTPTQTDNRRVGSAAASPQSCHSAPSSSAALRGSRRPRPSNHGHHIKKRKVEDDPQEGSSGQGHRRLSIDIGEIIRHSDKQRQETKEDWKSIVERNKELPLTGDPRRITEHNILLLLARVSYMQDQIPSECFSVLQEPAKQVDTLCNTECIGTLWNYCVFSATCFPRAKRLLIRICRNASYFQMSIVRFLPIFLSCKMKCIVASGDLLKDSDNKMDPSSVISKGTELTDNLLSSLTVIAESSFGQGLLTNLLLCGSTRVMLACSLALPYIIKDHTLLNRFLYDCDGFQNVLGALYDEELILSCYAQQSLSQLLQSLSITKHQGVTRQQFGQWPAKSLETDVSFELDDGSVVDSNRRALVVMSPVFALMLEGHFAEKHQSKVKISSVSRGALELLVLFCNRDRSKSFDGKKDDSTHTVNLDLLLECLGLGDRFVVMEFQHQAAEVIAKHCLSEDDIDHVIRVGSLHNCNWLIEQCVIYLLSDSFINISTLVARQTMWSKMHSNADLWAIIDKALCSMIQKALCR